jgi:hypothetical protein
MCEEPRLRDPHRAITHAEAALARDAKTPWFWNTLGVPTTGPATGGRRSRPLEVLLPGLGRRVQLVLPRHGELATGPVRAGNALVQHGSRKAKSALPIAGGELPHPRREAEELLGVTTPPR